MIARISLVASLATVLCLAPACSESLASSAAGTYSLDIDKTCEAVAQAKAGGTELTADQLKQAADVIKAMFKGGTLELKADMSFTSSAEIGMKKDTLKGTWIIDGDKLTFNQTHENGEEKTDTASGTLKDGMLTLTMEKGGMSTQMFFNKDAK